MIDYKVEFEHYLTDNKNASENTLQSYLRDLGQFCSYMDDRGVESPTKSPRRWCKNTSMVCWLSVVLSQP